MLIFTDASFDMQNKIAGIGIAIYDGMKWHIKSLWTRARTINEAELFAIHIGSILSNGRGKIYTDSQTAIAYIKGEIKEKPRTPEQYLNHKHCLFWAYQIRHNGVVPLKIKAHQHNYQSLSIGNRLADVLAADGRAKFYFQAQKNRSEVNDRR